MSVLLGSRYEYGDSDIVINHNGKYDVVVYPPPSNAALHSYVIHVVVDGERFDTIAASRLGDPRRWWVLADMNPEIEFPGGALTAGTLIRVPVT